MGPETAKRGSEYEEDWRKQRRPGVPRQSRSIIADRRGSHQDGNTPSRSDIRDQESTGATDSGNTADRNRDKEPNQVGKGFNDSKSSGNFLSRNKDKFRLTRKRGIIGIVTSGLIGGGMFGFSIIQGPMQIVHLGEMLKTFSFSNNETTNARAKSWYRLARSGNFGETRVGSMGSRLVNNRLDVLSKMGITFDGDKLDNLRSISFDTEELAKGRIPDIKGKSSEEAKALIAKEFNLPEEELKRTGIRGANGHKFTIVTRGENITKIRGFIDSIAHDPSRGPIYNAMTKRSFKKFYNAPSLFSPLKRLAAKYSTKVSTKMDKKERQKREKERLKRLSKAAESVNPSARGKLRDKVSGNTGKIIGGALITTAGMCFVRDVAEDVVEANRASIVAPALVDATDKISVASQIQSGDVDIDDVGGVVESLTDEDGKTIWQGTALKSISDPNFKFDPDAKDPNDLPPDYKQAFSNKTTASDLKETLGGGGVGSVACSAPGQAVQFVGGLALIAAGPFTSFASWAAFAAKAGAKAAATAGVMHFIQGKLASILSSDAVVPIPLSGPLGGNLLAYGAREAANVNARSNGGVELSADESAMIDREQVIAAQDEFKSKSLATQIFDINDYRSVASQFASSLSPSMRMNITNLGSSLLNVSKNFSTIFSILTPKIHADAQYAYSWDFPRYGIPKKIINDPKYEDPYENANLVATALDVDPIKDKYVERAKTCFGVSITKDSGVWDVIPENEVNPNSEKYLGAKCNDQNDELWIRIMLFVLDTRQMSAAACYELDDKEACINTGIDDDSNPQNSGSSTDSPGNANMKETITVDTPGKFITMPAHYSCSGRTTQIDSRIAPALAYLINTYDMCADDGLASGHKSHGAGLGVDLEPRSGNSKEVWKNTVERAARDMGWWGDAADAGKSSNGCAPAYSGYGQCMHVVYPDKFPQWVRWIGYNGDVDHGDPWHVSLSGGGSFAHLHLGWDTPNGDGAAPSIISSPRSSVYTFPAPIPDDLKDLL